MGFFIAGRSMEIAAALTVLSACENLCLIFRKLPLHSRLSAEICTKPTGVTNNGNSTARSFHCSKSTAMGNEPFVRYGSFYLLIV
jgi:hypothetical protein